MRNPTRFLALLVACGCGSDDKSSDSAADDTTGASTQATSSASTTATSTTAASQDGSTAATESADGSSSGGGGGSGLVVPCGDQGMANPDFGIICFFDVDNPDGEPAATIEHELGQINGEDALYIRLILAPWFVDNTYGTTALGWDNHKFGDLVGSDRAEIHLKNMAEESVLHFSLDYITADDTAVSGYRAMGIWGGEGEMIVGDEALVLASTTSIARNLNDRGYEEYIVDSPATDDDYTPNPATPDWDYRVVYEVWVSLAALTDVPVQACIDYIHASPSKLADNTVDVVPDECPPGWGCYKVDGCETCVNPDPDWNLCDPTGGGSNVP